MDNTSNNGRGRVAEEVRALLGRRQEHQKDLGALLNLSQPTISKRLNAEVPFDVDELFLITEHYDVPVTDLFGEEFRTGSFATVGELVGTGA